MTQQEQIQWILQNPEFQRALPWLILLFLCVVVVLWVWYAHEKKQQKYMLHKHIKDKETQKRLQELEKQVKENEAE